MPDNYNRYVEFEINTCLITQHVISITWCLKRVHSVGCQEAYCNARTSLKMPQMMIVSLKINCSTFRYLEKNVRYCSMYWQYSHSIPHFLVDRPRHLVNHCMERLDAAQCIPTSDITVVDSLLGEFMVKSQMEQNVVYSIKFADQSSMPNCDCPDWLQTYLPCKHFLAIFIMCLAGTGLPFQPSTENHQCCSLMTML